MTYDSFFQTGITRGGGHYIARWDGEWCGEHETPQAARKAIAARERMERTAVELDRAARPFFCDGRYGVWRAVERGESLPHEVERAFQANHAATMAFNRAMGRG